MMEKVTTETKSVIEDNNNIESFFEEILHTSPVVASGRDGIILKVDMSNFNSSLIEKINNKEIKISIGEGYALKILKIYREGDGEREYNIQKAAYEALENIDDIAKIPKPILVKKQHLSDADKEYLKKYNYFFSDDAEIILMDYIEGKDLAVIIYDFVLSNNGYDINVLENMDFEQKQETISNLLNFEIAKNANPGDFRDAISKRDNLRKLMNYLKKSNFYIKQDILDQIKEALNILESKGIFHNDLHERNIMISDDGKPYIIDFGRSANNKNDPASDDFAVIRRFSALNKEKTNEYDLKYWEDLEEKISKSKKWTPILKEWGKNITKKGKNIIYSTILSESVNENLFEQSLGALLYLFNTVNKENKDKILEIITQLSLSLKTEYTKRKIKNLKNYIEENL